ncbi:GMP synthase [Candidatus Roizmanbacteria bacterium RIFCSPHIGHO2_02_FULL_37_13b]|uniref:GMP synthetase n=1 Tax=Candidatus Roizmanbacteria bacterium RIFCSPLOWO2_02_FULL_36_11 TaxID=1802071 RepID=A0A1F7JBM2_9BACT|nr:MAG: GMP synthase [Candidatus Roizmanbacteria bacterium RIFCSPHIGHO2_02_FULL_37_13b]OGK53007.1 MAG: GMP synthase [Candidatus Roizmanbacteria bacterium RIFCSPLOWO2_02_FULL_36_11]
MNKKKVYVVDNGGQWTHRIWRVLRELDCETKIILNTTSLSEIDAQGLILSGGAARIEWESIKLGQCTDYLDNFKGPIMGVCLGHQIMAVHFGGKAGPASVAEYGLATLEVLEEDTLFKGLPKSFDVWQSHNDEVKEAPGFEILARSEKCPIQAMRHKTKPLFGVQFHPEVTNTEYGEQIYANFLSTIS